MHRAPRFAYDEDGVELYDADDLLSADPRAEFEEMLQRRCDTGESFALMLVELDGFGELSEEYGADIANLLLYEVASRLRRKLLEDDVVMRSGEGQFAVLLPEMNDIDRAEAKAYELIERLESPMKVSGTRFRLTASIGISLFPEHGDTWRPLLRNADAAAHDAKALGRGRISIGTGFPSVR